jgi:hypothetical protein
MLINESPMILKYVHNSLKKSELIKYIEKFGDLLDKLLMKLIRLAYEVSTIKPTNPHLQK